MLKKILLVLLISVPFSIYAQFTSSCKDSTKINLYAKCQGPQYAKYSPVCACDGQTYRNACAAELWGGIINAMAGDNYVNGICGNFDIDFVPNAVGATSTTTEDAFLHIFVNPILLPTSVQIYLFDVFNRVQYSRYLYATAGNFLLADTYLNADFFARIENGVYILLVTVNGEPKSKKIVIK